MSTHRTEFRQRRTSSSPACELLFDYSHHHGQLGKVSVVKAKSTNQLPDTLDRIEVGTVGRQECQREIGFLHFPPVAMQPSMVVFGVINDQHDSPTRSSAHPTQLPQKRFIREVPAWSYED